MTPSESSMSLNLDPYSKESREGELLGLTVELGGLAAESEAELDGLAALMAPSSSILVVAGAWWGLGLDGDGASRRSWLSLVESGISLDPAASDGFTEASSALGEAASEGPGVVGGRSAERQ